MCFPCSHEVSTVAILAQAILAQTIWGLSSSLNRVPGASALEMEASKRAESAMHPSKRPRFTREPDLEVEVEGKTFRLESRVLMAASDVFTKMLTSEMSEAQDGRIKRVDKKHSEFELLGPSAHQYVLQ